MSRTSRWILAAVAATGWAGTSVSAHHSYAGYDKGRVVRVEGGWSWSAGVPSAP